MKSEWIDRFGCERFGYGPSLSYHLRQNGCPSRRRHHHFWNFATESITTINYYFVALISYSTIYGWDFPVKLLIARHSKRVRLTRRVKRLPWRRMWKFLDRCEESLQSFRSRRRILGLKGANILVVLAVGQLFLHSRGLKNMFPFPVEVPVEVPVDAPEYWVSRRTRCTKEGSTKYIGDCTPLSSIVK